MFILQCSEKRSFNFLRAFKLQFPFSKRKDYISINASLNTTSDEIDNLGSYTSNDQLYKIGPFNFYQEEMDAIVSIFTQETKKNRMNKEKIAAISINEGLQVEKYYKTKVKMHNLYEKKQPGYVEELGKLATKLKQTRILIINNLQEADNNLKIQLIQDRNMYNQKVCESILDYFETQSNESIFECLEKEINKYQSVNQTKKKFQ